MTGAMNESWQVPVHSVEELGGRQHAYALVIPVINEGERIRAQLVRTAAADLPVDVVIADGGSTDGSLDLDFLRATGVRALLTKTGPGKLSAQLRMAYAWCLQQGYDGIVTIDGNGKDNVEAVGAFIERLQDGFDYVQGSRYLAGGKAENTPLERTIGNRFVHAPLMSLGGRHCFTDTTNGFRAYSARYLLDPRVQPFREEFSTYNLLFYLTVRAGQLGFRITEIPVVRSYPAQGRTPTKIAGLSSRLSILSEALNAATGAHSPPEAQAQPRRATAATFAVLVALLLVALAYALSDRIALSPDSWSYYELARSIPQDFYRFHFIRQFGDPPGYSSSFPPLWPVLLSLTDRITGAAAASGFYLAIVVCAAFAAASEAAGRRCFETRWVGLAAALLTMSHAGFIEEVTQGRTIPLQITIYALVLWQLARTTRVEQRPARDAAALGVLCGLALMNRFDALPFVLAMALVITALARGARLRVGCAFLSSAAIVISPWIAYSRSHFGRWFATDNSRTALSADPRAFVTDWWPGPQPSMFNAPGPWLHKFADNLLELFPSFLASPGAQPLVLWIYAALLIGVVVKLSLYSRPGQGITAAAGAVWHSNPQSWPVIGVALALFAMLPAYVLTGYFDPRYFAPQVWVIALLALGRTAQLLANARQRDLFGGFATVLMMVVTATVFVSVIRQTPPSGLSNFPRDRGDEAIRRCLFAKPGSPVLLDTDSLAAARMSAIYSWDVVHLPGNIERLNASQFRQFMKTYNITHIAVSDPALLKIIGQKITLVPEAHCPQSVVGWR